MYTIIYNKQLTASNMEFKMPIEYTPSRKPMRLMRIMIALAIKQKALIHIMWLKCTCDEQWARVLANDMLPLAHHYHHHHS